MAARCVLKLGRYRLDFRRYPAERFAFHSGGRLTPWPWRTLFVPRVGSLTLGRTRPRALRGDTNG